MSTDGARTAGIGPRRRYARPASGPKPFDYYLVNDDLDGAHDRMKAVLCDWYPHIAPADAARPNPCAGLTSKVLGWFGR